MATTVLITAHPGAALAQACLRGIWMPLPLTTQEACSLSHLVILSPTATCIAAMGRIANLQCSGPVAGQLHWSPLLAGRRRLRHPIPLGAGPLLQAWMPRHCLQWRLLPLQELLVAESVAALLSSQGLAAEASTSQALTSQALAPQAIASQTLAPLASAPLASGWQASGMSAPVMQTSPIQACPIQTSPMQASLMQASLMQAAQLPATAGTSDRALAG